MNGNTTSDLLAQDLQKAKQLAVNRLLRPNSFTNVVGIGIGYKFVDGEVTDTLCVRIYVHTKLDLDDITPAVLIPSSFLDIPTDVIEIGRLGRIGRVEFLKEATADDPIRPGSPIRVNTTAPNVNSGAAGTLGAVVQANNSRYILSCNHVLAVNGRVPADAQIVSGASIEIGKSPAVIARPGPSIEISRDQDNFVDCALAEVTDRNKVYAAFPDELGKVLFPDRPLDNLRGLGTKVKKFGAITGLTNGTIVDLDADFFVDYSFGTFRLNSQIVIDGQIRGQSKDVFASDGDSGSLLIGPDQTAIGMVFAEADRFALACPLQKVIERFKAKGFDLYPAFD